MTSGNRDTTGDQPMTLAEVEKALKLGVDQQRTPEAPNARCPDCTYRGGLRDKTCDACWNSGMWNGVPLRDSDFAASLPCDKCGARWENTVTTGGFTFCRDIPACDARVRAKIAAGLVTAEAQPVGEVERLECWLAAIREAAEGGDVSKNVRIMTKNALDGAAVSSRALRAYRARVPKIHDTSGTGTVEAGSIPDGSIGALGPASDPPCKDCGEPVAGVHGCSLFTYAKPESLSDENLVLLGVAAQHCAEVVEAVPALKRAVGRLVGEVQASRRSASATAEDPDDGCDCERFEGGDHGFHCSSVAATQHRRDIDVRKAYEEGRRSGSRSPLDPATFEDAAKRFLARRASVDPGNGITYREVTAEDLWWFVGSLLDESTPCASPSQEEPCPMERKSSSSASVSSPASASEPSPTGSTGARDSSGNDRVRALLKGTSVTEAHLAAIGSVIADVRRETIEDLKRRGLLR